ncbi:hypothetical protein BKA65DRAFT_591052 [Rhexocercosporidium sp. MPI-PUGE-AT-0058]|nr:hypothetical protein BKA65DRAFT_591052 [Rhexocercosporidium sp. MPI-PUGE-AT-0058]
MSSPTQSAIIWPQEFLPGTTSNFVTNEVIASNLSTSQIWPLLSNISKWTSYYNNESVAPQDGKPGRIAWSAHLEGGEEESVSVYHAWLVEDLSGGRVSILTQESQNGKPAEELARRKPNKVLLGHQDWCEGLLMAARGMETGETNLKAAGLGAYPKDM